LATNQTQRKQWHADGGNGSSEEDIARCYDKIFLQMGQEESCTDGAPSKNVQCRSRKRTNDHAQNGHHEKGKTKAIAIGGARQ